MTSDDIVQEVLTPPADWEDTPEQAQLRQCLISALSGHDSLVTMTVAGQLIDFLRDHLMAGAAEVRRKTAKLTRDTTDMSIREIAAASGQSHQAISRLITESRR